MLLPWVGGKSNLAARIIGIFPPHRRYIEPFFGGGWVFFKKQTADQNVINDINGDLINLYRIVRDRPHDITRLMAYTPKSEEEFDRMLTLYNDPELWHRTDSVTRAMIYYFLIKNSFNGLTKIFSVISTGWWGEGILEIVQEVGKKLKNTDILNRDYQDVIKSYADSDTLLYLDPPYAVTIKEKEYYYEYVLTREQHVAMRDLLLSPEMKNRKFKFVISYDIHPFVDELYRGQEGIRMYLTKEVFQSSINKNTLTVEGQDRASAFKQEYLITNYDIIESSPLFYGAKGI